MLPNLGNYEKSVKTFRWENLYKEFSFKNSRKVNYAYEITDYQVKKGRGSKKAIIFQDQNGKITNITFKELAKKTSIFAKNFQLLGLKAGDRFGLYASKSIEYVIVMLAAIKCGAIVVPLFSAFGQEAVLDRLNDCDASWLFVDKVFTGFLGSHLITSQDVKKYPRKNYKDFKVEFGDLETPFIIHYTSGSTAKPKGILLPQRAMIGHYITAKYVLDLHKNDRFWNTGDPGWVTGMVYNFFAPLLLGIAAHVYEGPFKPLEWVKFMKTHKITVWYSTPTAFRLLRYYGAPLYKKEIPSLRHIVSAGEPLNPSLIDWTMENLGIPIHDSWYMTENGHQLINNYRCVPIRKGSMGKALPGIKAAIIDDAGKELLQGEKGRLAIRTPWPGLMKTVWGNQKKFEAYFQNGWYISGDIAYQDKEGYFWFQGREDDMIKSAAERISPFEIESVLVSHPAIAEAGVIGKPDEIFGQIVKAFVMLKSGKISSEELKTDIIRHVRKNLSVHEVPREIEFVDKLPKTKSGKIMRRVLRCQETKVDAGDLSTIDAEMNPVLSPQFLPESP